MCYSLFLGRAGKEACGLWQILAWWFYWGLFWFFVFCFNESLLPCCQLWRKPSCTKSLNFPLHRDMRLHHPGLNATCGYFQLVMLGNSPKATAGVSGEARGDRSCRPDHSTAITLPCSPSAVKPLHLCLSPSPRQLHKAEGEGEKRNTSSNRWQLQCLNFYCLHAVIPNKAPP